MYLSLSGSEVNQYYYIIFRCRVTGPLGQTRTVNPATNEPEDPQDFPKPSCISETDSLRKCGVSIWGKMCRTWESHGKIIGRRWAKDGTTFLLGCNCWVSFFGWRNLRNLIQYSCSWFVRITTGNPRPWRRNSWLWRVKASPRLWLGGTLSLQLTLIEHFKCRVAYRHS